MRGPPQAGAEPLPAQPSYHRGARESASRKRTAHDLRTTAPDSPARPAGEPSLTSVGRLAGAYKPEVEGCPNSGYPRSHVGHDTEGQPVRAAWKIPTVLVGIHNRQACVHSRRSVVVFTLSSSGYCRGQGPVMELLRGLISCTGCKSRTNRITPATEIIEVVRHVRRARSGASSLVRRVRCSAGLPLRPTRPLTLVRATEGSASS